MTCNMDYKDHSHDIEVFRMQIASLQAQIHDLQEEEGDSFTTPLSLGTTLPTQIDADYEAYDLRSRSIERCYDKDELYLYGMVDPTVVTPTSASDFGSGVGQYLLATRYRTDVPTIVWSDLSTIVGSIQDVYVKVSENDTTAGFLYSSALTKKIISSDGTVSIDIQNGGADEQLNLTVDGANHTHNVTTLTGGDEHDFLYFNDGAWHHDPFFTALGHTNPGSNSGDIMYWNGSTWGIGPASGSITLDTDDLSDVDVITDVYLDVAGTRSGPYNVLVKT